ncbi:alpha/beta fold hydrolase [Nocardia sp. NPDC020380]|uniref:alpha/beta fold hydrolase n=1 Tax=Nocardia sp. NPDC020380 TaxID=3364309 RepID=UPI00378E64AA
MRRRTARLPHPRIAGRCESPSPGPSSAIPSNPETTGDGVRGNYRKALHDRVLDHQQRADGSDAISRTDIAGDLLALIGHLGGPAIIIGNSISGGAATIAAAQGPESVSAIIELNPFTRTQGFDTGAFLTIPRYRKGLLRLGTTQLFKSLPQWLRYLDVAYPIKPADYDRYMTALAQKLREPGRFAEFMKTGKTTPADAEAQLPHITCPALVIMGTADPDFPHPAAEGEAIATLMPPGLGDVASVEGGGHHIQADSPDRVAELTLKFLSDIGYR